MELLLAKRERLMGDLELMGINLETVRSAVDEYGAAIARFSKDIVTRPRRVMPNPEHSFNKALHAFTNAGFEKPEWRNGFNNPQVHYTEWELPGHHGMKREAFDPEFNRKYLGLHGENLAQIKGALHAAELRASNMQAELQEVKTEVANEARDVERRALLPFLYVFVCESFWEC
ncbi:MAG: hypothetical protein ACJ8EB_03585, partial [Allosphingosinicella sp.]